MTTDSISGDFDYCVHQHHPKYKDDYISKLEDKCERLEDTISDRDIEIAQLKEREVNYFVNIYGERWRVLIKDSLMWLDEKETTWNLPSPMNRYRFITTLIEEEN